MSPVLGAAHSAFNLLAFITYQRDKMPVMCCQTHSTCPSGPWPFYTRVYGMENPAIQPIHGRYTVAHNSAYNKCMLCQRPIWGLVKHLNLRFRAFNRARGERGTVLSRNLCCQNSCVCTSSNFCHRLYCLHVFSAARRNISTRKKKIKIWICLRVHRYSCNSVRDIGTNEDIKCRLSSSP